MVKSAFFISHKNEGYDYKVLFILNSHWCPLWYCYWLFSLKIIGALALCRRSSMLPEINFSNHTCRLFNFFSSFFFWRIEVRNVWQTFTSRVLPISAKSMQRPVESLCALRQDIWRSPSSCLLPKVEYIWLPERTTGWRSSPVAYLFSWVTSFFIL